MPLNVLAISGSLRTASYNRKALQIAKTIAAGLDAVVTEIDLRELNLPLYDQDIQDQGMPESVLKLKAACEAADALLIASPEYNYSISGALKNALDWASRGGNSLSGKVAAIFGASDGRIGTARGQVHLRQVLIALNVMVTPQPQVCISLAKEAFNEDSSLKDPKLNDQFQKLITNTLTLAQKLKV